MDEVPTGFPLVPVSCSFRDVRFEQLEVRGSVPAGRSPVAWQGATIDATRELQLSNGSTDVHP